jgi:hypothetical protein
MTVGHFLRVYEEDRPIEDAETYLDPDTGATIVRLPKKKYRRKKRKRKRSNPSKKS